MGFFKDVRTLSAMGREMQRDSDPGRDLATMTDQLRTMNEAYAGGAAPGQAPADAVPGSVQIVQVGGATGSIDADPILTVEVLVHGDGLPPMPASVSLLVPMGQLARLVPGAVLPALVSRSQPGTFCVQWDGI